MHCLKTYSNCIFFFHYGLPEQSFNIQFGLQWKKTRSCVHIDLLTLTSSRTVATKCLLSNSKVLEVFTSFSENPVSIESVSLGAGRVGCTVCQ